MKILLISPERKRKRNEDFLFKLGFLNLPYIAAVTPADVELANRLRKQQSLGRDSHQPPILLVVNRCDNEQRRAQIHEFYELGIGDPIPISALHGTGTGDMLDSLMDAMQTQAGLDDDEENVIKLAIIGRPNVGKSSLLNRLLGEERAIVSPIPGTTRDAIDTQLTYYGTPLILIDTAGIRRRGKIESGVERYSVIRALKAIDRADVVLLLVDATESVIAQDTHIAGMAIDKAKSIVVIVNKWDAIDKDAHTMPAYTEHIQQELNFMDYVPVLFISAKTGIRVGQVIPTALRVQEERLRRIPTGQLNRLLRKALHDYPPPSRKGKRLRTRTYA